MLDSANVRDSLNAFGKYVIQQSRSNLSKKKKNVNGDLYKSLDYTLRVMPNSFSMSFLMEEYGVYQDKGVKGKESSIKAPNSPFKFGSGKGKKGGLSEGILKWVKNKRIRFRDEQGRFTKGNYKSIAFVIARSVYKTGIKPSLFFTKPFNKAFENLPDDIVESFGLDVEQFLKFTVK